MTFMRWRWGCAGRGTRADPRWIHDNSGGPFYCIIRGELVGQPLPRQALRRPGGRKVRAPQDRVPDNVRETQVYDQCNRKQTADGPRAQARVKGCGKSAPLFQQWGRHGKLHLEQDQIDPRQGVCPRRGWVDCLSRRATGDLDEWLPPACRHRTRLTDRLTLRGPAPPAPTPVALSPTFSPDPASSGRQCATGALSCVIPPRARRAKIIELPCALG